MRITVEIDDNTLQKLHEVTGERKKAPAVQKALDAFLFESRKRAFLDRVDKGETDYSMTNDELEAMFQPDSGRHVGVDRIPAQKRRRAG